jgi:hypothetical protein
MEDDEDNIDADLLNSVQRLDTSDWLAPSRRNPTERAEPVQDEGPSR